MALDERKFILLNSIVSKYLTISLTIAIFSQVLVSIDIHTADLTFMFTSYSVILFIYFNGDLRLAVINTNTTKTSLRKSFEFQDLLVEIRFSHNIR